MNALLKLQSLWFFVGIMLLATSVSPAKPHSNSNVDKTFGFDDVKDSLVLIQTDNAVGSGFIIQDGDQRYIITNQHVILGSNSIRFRTISGIELKPVKVEVSQARDIARLQIRGSGGVKISSDIQQGYKITVLGNSQGMGVVTWLDGTISEVLKDRFEVTAGFVQGNSGSPVFDPHGNVLGVASYVLIYSETTTDGDAKWGSLPRRFAYQLEGVKWQSVSWKAYNKKYGMTLNQIDEFNDQLFDVVIKWSENPYGKILSEDIDNRDLKKWVEKHNSIINRLDRMRYSWKLGSQSWGEDKKLDIIIDDTRENRSAFTKLCDDKIRFIDMFQNQRDNTVFINNELEKRADELKALSDYAQKFSRACNQELIRLRFFR
ncbi:serine protease [Pontiellaceae bacterium B12227]|nr:serine protease [Pontiellaceae bacterium B12227]